MKKTLLIASICALLSCSNDKKNESVTTENETKIETSQTQNISPSELKKYNSVKEMLEDAHDFTVEQGTLKFINTDEKNLHIQVSKPTIEGDSDKTINEMVKRDIVYIAFQAFAQTSINKITITSIPIDFNNKKKYYDEYKRTVTLTRDRADQIMQKEFDTKDYSILFVSLDEIQTPSDNFSKLKFQDLDLVYSELSK
ncbi:hypothetical protein [Chryseobacterium sp. OV279]|uniref:hypothetical protein n=1 Tax=Chryseobacterium sp. OV279 TaxID=1500285 RepID=UPI0009155677|nr:hypothetical protein [Chryseobacterium sp. OV279]SHE79724.1 hypothetical protein SAMN02787100_0861 [Chryseobacterium sp. OV279]